MIKLTTDRAAVVHTDLKWIPIKDRQPPRGARCLVIDRKMGVARIDLWNPGSGASHWFPLPTFMSYEDEAE